MGQFDTHGGYFAPKDYFRVNTGGSHEENPNGGVQVGVDPNGVPNMLEEGEPVYKDYVYSDNIRADAKFLEENHIPVKFAGKLYSEIADKFVDEAEERPNDPISNNGLNAMLLRLAEAQEAQKAAQEQAELEEELANLSPEELEQLEMMLAQGQPEVPQEEMIPEEQMGPAMPVEQAPMQMPVMGCGGFLRKYDEGGPLGNGNIEDNLDDILARIQAANAMRSSYDEAVRELNTAKGALSRQKFGYYLTGRNSSNTNKAVRNLEEKLIQQLSTLSDNEGGIYTDPNSSYSKAMNTSIQQTRDALKKARERQAKYDARIAKKQSVVDEAQGKVDRSFATLQAVSSGLPYIYNPTPSNSESVSSPVQQRDSIVTTPLRTQIDTFAVPTYTPADSAAWLVDNYIDEIDREYTEPQNVEKPASSSVKLSGGLGHIVSGYNEDSFGGYARGGQMNRFDNGGWEKFLADLNNYSISRNRSNAQGKYRIDRGFPLYGYKDIYTLEQSDPYKAFTQYVLNNPNDENVQKYLRTLDAGTADWTEKLFDGDTLKSNWKSLYDARRNDQKGGIYHFSGAWDNLDDLSALARQRVAAVNAPVGFGDGFNVITPNGTLLGMPATVAARNTKADNAVTEPAEDVAPVRQNYVPLPTAGRYAKALGAAALGLYDLAQEPYKYQFPEIRPQAPWGTVNYQPLVYNPMDWAIPYNAQMAQTNAALRSLKGNPISLGQNVIGLDKVATENTGNAMNQTWSANNQHRNEIIAGNNQTEGARAGFDYGVSKDRALLFDQAARMNFQKELYRQRLNQEEETAKYTALGNQINTGLDALAGIGTENFRMNQVNTNTALQGYQVVPNGMGGYKLVPSKNITACGGTLLKKHKK